MPRLKTLTQRIILPIPPELLTVIDTAKPPIQSRAEWIREAIRRRILQEDPERRPT